jgi:hypothetical protein
MQFTSWKRLFPETFHLMSIGAREKAQSALIAGLLLRRIMSCY